MSSGRFMRGVRWVGVALIVTVLSTGATTAATDRADGSRSRDARAAGAAVVSGTFAGKTEGALIAVAVVAEAPAAEGQARTISMYVCNGTSLDAWLTGQATANSAVLRSADRRFNARVTLTQAGASGVLALPTGGQFQFTARPAVGVAGLFHVVVATTGSFRGTSTTGATVTGAAKLRVNRTASATISADGRAVEVAVTARSLTPGAYRWIVLPDRKVLGANTLGPSHGAIGGLAVFRPASKSKLRKISASSAGIKGWGNGQCQALAAKWEKLVDAAAKDILNGNDAAADAKLNAASGVLNQVESKCVVTGIG